MKKILLVLILCIFAQTASFAINEGVKKVYLQEAIDAALKNNIDLQAVQLEINIAKNNIKSANRLQNPEFNAFYNFGILNDIKSA